MGVKSSSGRGKMMHLQLSDAITPLCSFLSPPALLSSWLQELLPPTSCGLSHTFTASTQIVCGALSSVARTTQTHGVRALACVLPEIITTTNRYSKLCFVL